MEPDVFVMVEENLYQAGLIQRRQRYVCGEERHLQNPIDPNELEDLYWIFSRGNPAAGNFLGNIDATRMTTTGGYPLRKEINVMYHIAEIGNRSAVSALAIEGRRDPQAIQLLHGLAREGNRSAKQALRKINASYLIDGAKEFGEGTTLHCDFADAVQLLMGYHNPKAKTAIEKGAITLCGR